MPPPWQVGIYIIAGLITGTFGALIGRIRHRGKLGFWLGFFLSLFGILVIAIVAAVPSDSSERAKAAKGAASEEAQMQQAADRLRIEKEAARRVAAEGDQQP
jgi:hypothetical protein